MTKGCFQSTRWVERPIDLNTAQQLSFELGIPLLLAKMLVARNIADTKTATEFLAPSLKNLTEPLQFMDMDKALARIVQAIHQQEQIGVFGDYDVDGVCATAILQQFLTSVGAQVFVTLPHRMTEGYGLSRSGIHRLYDQGARLLITADCGILAHDEIAYAESLGFDVIVVDHHNPSAKVPNAWAVINPKRLDCQSKADYLCAAGVAFFLCAAIRRHLREQGYFVSTNEPDIRDLLDLVALATVCDVVPLVKDNRALVKSGLSVLKRGSRIGLLALMEACNIDKDKITSTNLGFHLGPRINAAGRLDDATLALDLLNTMDQASANAKAMELHQTNEDRRLIEEETVQHACRLIDHDLKLQDQAALVLYDESWHPGVVGIVASRIAERYHRPAIIIGQNGKGSGRSIKGIDLYEMVAAVSHSLKGFGGHAHAIGVTLGPVGVARFSDDLTAEIKKRVPNEVFNKEIFYDTDVAPSDVTLSMIDELHRLEPFGAKNPYPVVRINRCFARNLRRLTGGHLKGELECPDGVISFIGFRMNMDDDDANSLLDVLGVPDINEWQGRKTVQLRLIDYKKTPLNEGLS